MSGRYPSDEELARIVAWPVEDCAGLLAFVRSIWNWPEYAWEAGGMIALATGGWSGNEDIIAALQENQMFWILCWQSSHRGGMHWFKPYKQAAK